jgi:hypothetical protein
LLAIALCAACGRLPETFAPPPQRAPFFTVPADGPGYFLSMDDPNAGAYLVQGVADRGPGTWRWAFDHPVLRFFVPGALRLQFTMEFTIPESTFRDTGPVTLSISMNGRPFDRPRCERAGQQSYTHAVPSELLRANAINLVAIDPHPVWVSRADGGHLGFILSRAGFTE